MNDEKNTPELRFSEFTDSWKDYKIGELFDERSDKMPNGELLSVTIKDGIKKHSESGRRDSSSEDKSNYKKVCVGDIAYNSMRMWQGASGFSEYEGIISPAYTVIKPKENVDAKCAAYLFKCKKMTNIFQRHSQGVASDTWNLKYPELSKIHIMFPENITEQLRISSFFSKMDSVIALQQQYIDQLKEFKKGCLQKMFPKKGEKVPEMRFPGAYNDKGEWVAFTGDWEQRKLGDVVQITMGQSPNGSTYSEEPSDHILVQGNADLQNGWVKPRVWTTQKTKTADAGDLIMSVRAPAGAMGKTAYNAVIGRGVAAIKGNEFIYQTLVKMDSDGYWKKLAAGSTFESINSDTVFNAEIMLPSEPEQEKIGQYFLALDNLITLHQRKLDEMKEFKKGCLQKMFV